MTPPPATSAADEPPAASAEAAPTLPAVPPGSRLEQALLLLRLLLDVASIPFHLLAFVVTRPLHRRRLRRAMAERAP